MNIFLDMDGVIVNFSKGVIDVMNDRFKTNLTIDDYVIQSGGYYINEFFGVGKDEFWTMVDKDWWINLEPFPWSLKLYEYLKSIGEVTILTAPNDDPNCLKSKMIWLNEKMGIESNDVMIGSKKYLLAGNGILIDDYYHNIDLFKQNGGHAILVPSNWNTLYINYEMVYKTIYNNI